jgi:hypothetical protein
MRIFPLVCSGLAAVVSVAQAEPPMKQSEPMRLTEQQMNTITAGARGVADARGALVISHAFGTKSSYSRSTSFSILNRAGSTRAGISFGGHGRAVACCGTGTSTHVEVSPNLTKLSDYLMTANYPSIVDGHHRYFYNY